MSRKVWTALLIVAVMPPGFVLGAMLGAAVLVPRNAGLAGGAMVLWYGLLGLLLAGISALLLGWRLRPSRLRPVASLAAAVALVTLAWLGLRIAVLGDERADQRRDRAIAPDRPEPLLRVCYRTDGQATAEAS